MDLMQGCLDQWSTTFLIFEAPTSILQLSNDLGLQIGHVFDVYLKIKSIDRFNKIFFWINDFILLSVLNTILLWDPALPSLIRCSPAIGESYDWWCQLLYDSVPRFSRSTPIYELRVSQPSWWTSISLSWHYPTGQVIRILPAGISIFPCRPCNI